MPCRGCESPEAPGFSRGDASLRQALHNLPRPVEIDEEQGEHEGKTQADRPLEERHFGIEAVNFGLDGIEALFVRGGFFSSSAGAVVRGSGFEERGIEFREHKRHASALLCQGVVSHAAKQRRDLADKGKEFWDAHRIDGLVCERLLLLDPGVERATNIFRHADVCFLCELQQRGMLLVTEVHVEFFHGIHFSLRWGPCQGIMTTDELVTRTYGHLGIGQSVYWPQDEVVSNGLNPAQRLLCLLKPDLVTVRTVITQEVDDTLIDLRVKVPRSFRLQRITLGDVSLTASGPVATQGRMGDLRRISLASLRQQRDWMTRFAPVSTHWYTHGLTLIGLWPRNSRQVTLTLTHAALPAPLTWSVPTQEPDLPTQWHPVIADLAAPTLMLKEGQTEVEIALKAMEAIIQTEPVRQLLKQMQAEKYREQAMQARESASAER